MSKDLCGKEGAVTVEGNIRSAWGQVGAKLDIKRVDQKFATAMRGRRTDVRSELVNGLPPGATGVKLVDGKLHCIMKDGQLVPIPVYTPKRRK